MGRRSELLAAIVLALVVPIGVYALAALAAAKADGAAVAEVVCFDPGRLDPPPLAPMSLAPMSVDRMAAAVVMALAAVTFLFVIPGLLGMLAFMRRTGARSMAHLWSLATNSAALMLVFLILRHSVGVHRVSLAAAWLGWTAVLFALAWQPKRSVALLNHLGQRYGSGLLTGLIVASLGVCLFFPEQFLQCFNEDSIEVYELARSLPDHFLPYWELETRDWTLGNRLGTVVVNPSLINSYWTSGLQLLLGGMELPTRLPYWIWWMGIFAVSYRIVRPREKRRAWLAAILLGLLAFLSTLLFTFYVGYNQYMADVANPGVTDALFTLALLLAFDGLRQQDGWGVVVSMVLASLVLYGGSVFLLALLAAAWTWQPIERREVVRWGLRAVGLLTAIAAFYVVWGALEGSLPAWLDTLDTDYLNDYFAAAPRWKSGAVFFGYFLLGCGGIPALGLVRAFRLGAWERTVATTTLLYLLVVLSSGFKNLHYLGPLWPIPIILFLIPKNNQPSIEAELPANKRRATTAVWLLAALSLMLCIVVCWPKARATFTLNRDLGRQTTIASDSQMTALKWARIRLTLIERKTISWYYGPHVWAAYAQWDPSLAQPRPLVLTDGEPPLPKYLLVASRPVEGTETTAKLYARDEKSIRWLTDQPVMRPLDRYPAIMRPLADGPYSPHNNTLTDVQRLRWPW